MSSEKRAVGQFGVRRFPAAFFPYLYCIEIPEKKKRRESAAFQNGFKLTHHRTFLAAPGHDRRLKNCTSRSCWIAASRVSKVPRFLRLPVFGLTLRESSRYWPVLSLRIMGFSLAWTENAYAAASIFHA